MKAKETLDRLSMEMSNQLHEIELAIKEIVKDNGGFVRTDKNEVKGMSPINVIIYDGDYTPREFEVKAFAVVDDELYFYYESSNITIKGVSNEELLKELTDEECDYWEYFFGDYVCTYQLAIETLSLLNQFIEKK